MNSDLVQELAEEAGAKFPFGGFPDYEQFDHEKFAKLIVTKCANIYETIDNGNLHLGTDDYLEALYKTFMG